MLFRSTREKVKGSKNEYRQVHQEEYILADGQHEAIISEELWNKAHEKREITGVKSPSKIGRDRAHLLSGILKCPKCGGPMKTAGKLIRGWQSPHETSGECVCTSNTSYSDRH